MNLIKCFLVLFILNFSLYGQSQINIDVKDERQIISTTGLNLRNAPSLNATILKKLPFGTKVEVIQNTSFKIDSIGKDIGYYENKKYESSIIGSWVEVVYQKQKGFLFDPYLGTVASLKGYNDSESNLNKDYILLFPGADCRNNFWSVKDMYLIGIYKTGNSFKLEEISLSYYIEVDKEYNEAIGDSDIPYYTISTNNNNNNLLFIIGSKKKITEKIITGIYKANWNENNFSNFNNIQMVGSLNNPKVLLKRDSKEQVLHSENKDLEPPIHITFEGDLDGDGKLDYIISYDDKNMITYLYLSSEAEKGKLVKPVAVYLSGFCC